MIGGLVESSLLGEHDGQAMVPSTSFGAIFRAASIWCFASW